jgi:hypothetical protein
MYQQKRERKRLAAEAAKASLPPEIRPGIEVESVSRSAN